MGKKPTEITLEITKEEFIELYKTMNHIELMNKLGLKNNQFYNFVKKLRLRKKRGKTPRTIVFKDK